MSKIPPLVSVVITTKNEEKNIENCLISIKVQTYQNIEIIVVDNNSFDKTKKLSLKYTKNVYNKGPERSVQRNFGMANKSGGQYVMFVDADMMLAPYLVESCVDYMQNSEDLALHIPEVILGTNYLAKVRRFERSFYDGTVIDGARFFDKEKFQEVGGFDERMSGPEDWDIDKKIKKIGHIGLLKSINRDLSSWKLNQFITIRGVTAGEFSNGIFHNEVDFVLKDYLHKKGYYAKSFDTYIAKWGRHDSDIKKQFGLMYRYFFVFVEKGKWRKFIAHPCLAIGMFFLRFLVGLTFLTRTRKIVR
jgi:glycosyltransferase involved in cell wall biosynthesis